MMLQAQDIHLQRGEASVLCGVNLAVQPGEVLGIIGPNGAGKSTLLQILAGLLPPTEGQVQYQGVPLASLPAPRRARLLAYLEQNSKVHWPLTAQAVVQLGRYPHQFDPAARAADQTVIDAALSSAGASALRNRPMSQLSAGEQARVLFARALAVEAQLLLADEPVASLDPFHQLQVMGCLQDLALAGRGVGVVLHDLSLAARFCDRLALLHEGSLLALGTPRDVLRVEHLAAAYGVACAIIEHEGELIVQPWASQPGEIVHR